MADKPDLTVVDGGTEAPSPDDARKTHGNPERIRVKINLTDESWNVTVNSLDGLNKLWLSARRNRQSLVLGKGREALYLHPEHIMSIRKIDPPHPRRPFSDILPPPKPEPVYVRQTFWQWVTGRKPELPDD